MKNEFESAEVARRFGAHAARKVFERRGNHAEAHMSEEELAMLLAFAYECGANRVAPKSVPGAGR